MMKMKVIIKTLIFLLLAISKIVKCKKQPTFQPTQGTY
jgi:hypothetical protein